VPVAYCASFHKPIVLIGLSYKALALLYSGAFAGESFSPAPPFLPCAGLSFLVGCAPPTAARALPAYLSAFGRQLFTARFAGCGRGPSLRCVRLRRFCSLPPASALPNRAVLSHPLRGAYCAFALGGNVCGPVLLVRRQDFSSVSGAVKPCSTAAKKRETWRPSAKQWLSLIPIGIRPSWSLPQVRIGIVW